MLVHFLEIQFNDDSRFVSLTWRKTTFCCFNLMMSSWSHFTLWRVVKHACHYSDVIMDTIASQITSLTIVYSTVYTVTRKMFPFDDVIMHYQHILYLTVNWTPRSKLWCGIYIRHFSCRERHSNMVATEWLVTLASRHCVKHRATQ